MNTAKGEIFFKGVYIIVYKTIANRPNIKELKFISNNRYSPKKPIIEQNKMASKMFKIPEGSGLVDVLDIRASVLDSIIWLKPFEDPVINTPPIINSKKTIEDKLPPASK